MKIRGRLSFHKYVFRLFIFLSITICPAGCFKNPNTPQLTTEVSDSAVLLITIHANIISDGGSDIFQKGICWGTHQNVTISDSCTKNDNENEDYYVLLNGLTGTTYYYRSYAVSGAGIGYGNEVLHKFPYANESGENILPNIFIERPLVGFLYLPGDIIKIIIDGSDPDGIIERIELFANDSLIGTLSKNWEFDWKDAPVGEFELSARAIDNLGGVGYTSKIPIKVLPAIRVNGVISDLVKSEKDELVFGLNQTLNQLLLINPRTKTLSSIPLPFAQPVSMDYSFNDKKLYILYKTPGLISIWDENTKSFSSINYSSSSEGLKIKTDSKNRRIYVLSNTGLDILNMDGIIPILYNGAVEGQLLEINPNEGLIFTANTVESPATLFKYSVLGDTITHLQTNHSTEYNVLQVVINPDTNYLVLPSGGGRGGDYKMSAYNTEDINNVMGTFYIGTYPKFATFSTDGKILIGVNGNPYDTYLYIMNAQTFTQIKKLFAPYIYDLAFRAVTDYSGTKLIAFCSYGEEHNRYLVYFLDL